MHRFLVVWLRLGKRFRRPVSNCALMIGLGDRDHGGEIRLWLNRAVASVEQNQSGNQTANTAIPNMNGLCQPK